MGHHPLLTLSTAFFELDRENTPVRDSSGTGTVVAAGQSRVKGVEASLAGYISDKWQISAGYANLNARFVTDTSNAAGTVAARAGAHVPFVPTHTPTRYGTAMTSPTTGVSASASLHRTATTRPPTTRCRRRAFTRVDAAIFWRLNKFVRAQLNVENIFGAKYYHSADANNNITIGSPRAARFVLTTNFTGDDRSAPLWGPEPRRCCGRPPSAPPPVPRSGLPARPIDGQEKHGGVPV